MGAIMSIPSQFWIFGTLFLNALSSLLLRQFENSQKMKRILEIE